jgi:putative redox protein
MAKISSSLKNELYKIEIKSQSGNIVIADEPIDMGGMDRGFSPKELLASALAACSSATVKMYADRKNWDLQEVKINIELDFIAKENKTIVNRKVAFIGNLDESQKSRLLAVANTCPVHKMLSNPIEIITMLEDNLKH